MEWRPETLANLSGRPSSEQIEIERKQLKELDKQQTKQKKIDRDEYLDAIKTHRKTKREINHLQEIYNDLKEKFKKFNEPWVYEEIDRVYTVLIYFPNVKLREFRKAIYELALELERTMGAIKWMHKHIFSNKTDLHRGKEVIQFRKEKRIA